MKTYKEFLNEKIDERSKLIDYIIQNQNDVEWEYYPDEDFPIDIETLNSSDIDELIVYKSTLEDIVEQEHERYQRDTVKHGRSE